MCFFVAITFSRFGEGEDAIEIASHYQEEIKSELQRLVDLLGITTGLFNVECRVCTNGKAYLMEVSPRAGGNRLAEMLNYAADVNINAAETKKTLGLRVEGMHEPNYKGHFAILVLHSDKDGVFDSIQIDKNFMNSYVLEEELRVNKGTVLLRSVVPMQL